MRSHSMRRSRRQSLVSILTKNCENVNLRLLRNDMKTIHKKQVQRCEVEHRFQMELCADIVSYLTLKSRHEKEMNEKLLKLVRILVGRTDKRVKIGNKKDMPDNAFSILLKNEEINLVGRIRNVGRIMSTTEDLIDFANKKDDMFDKDIDLLTEVNLMQKKLVETMIKADKSVTQLERKLKHKNTPDLDLDVSLVKSKQNFDIAARQMRAFTQEWNQRQVFTVSGFFTDTFAEVSSETLRKVATINDEQLQREKNSLKIYQQSLNAIEKEDLSNSVAFDLKLILEDQIEPKLADFDQSNEFMRQLHETKLTEIDKRLDRFAKEEELLIRMVRQETNPVPILTVTQSKNEIMRQLASCRHSIVKCAIERSLQLSILKTKLYARAVKPHLAKNKDYLSFPADGYIELVTTIPTDGCLTGIYNGKIGIFPEQNIEILNGSDTSSNLSKYENTFTDYPDDLCIPPSINLI